MRNILHDFLTDLYDIQRISLAVAKGHAARDARQVDAADPASWEFSGFSQNGEDGIIEVLLSALLRREQTFLEIGAADGVQNNSSWLMVVRQFHGLMVEGSRALSAKAERLLSTAGIGVEFRNCFVTRENAAQLLAGRSREPDLFSLDIDSNDYHVAQALLDAGLRPRIAVLEYNSVFGPERSVTIPYTPQFDYRTAHPSRLYYGVSLAAWRNLWTSRGYRFVTVDRNGVNAFFADPSQFREGFLDAVVPRTWAENAYQVRASGKRGEEQFALIRGLPLLEV